MADNTVFEVNMDTLKNRLEPCYEGIREYKKNKPEKAERVVLERSAKEEIIFAVEKDNRLWYLNSRYDAETAADIWVQGIEELQFGGVLIVCGISDFRCIRELLAKCDSDNTIMIYEPDPEILITVLEETDVSDILSDERIYVFSEQINMKYFKIYFSYIFQLEKIPNSCIYVLPNYGMIFKEEIEKFMELFNKCVLTLQVDKNTNILFGHKMNDNTIDNIWHSIFASSINELKESMDIIDKEKFPCIIVAAGPSLDKNIDQLTDAQGKALIIAVDTAIRALLAKNIIPDIVITLDPHKQMVLFEDERVRRIPLVACQHSRVEVLRSHTGKVFMFASCEYINHIYKHFGKDISVLPTAGSVANNAFSLAKYLEFKTIIMIGQDLAFTDDRKHVANAYEEKGISSEESDEYTQIEGQDGSTLLTYKNFKLYRDWFETEIADNPQLHVINSTEGGAMIHGAENEPLAKAIKKYCNAETDFSGLIESVPDSFDDKQKKEFYEMLVMMPERIQDLKRQFKKGIQNYNRFSELMSKGKNGTAEFSRILKEIEDVNNLDKTEILMEFILFYANEDEYAVREAIYSDGKRKSAASEGRRIADHGIHMLKAYIKSCDRILERLEYVFAEIVDTKKAAELSPAEK